MKRWLGPAALLVACGARTDLGGASRGGPDASPDASPDAIADAQPDAPSPCSDQRTLAKTGAQPDAIALDGGWVYWHERSGVWRVPEAGGPAQQLASAGPALWPDLAAFTIGGGYVFYADVVDVMRVPTGGGAAEPLGFTMSQPGFAANATGVLAWPRQGSPGEIDFFDDSGKGFAEVAQISESPRSIVVDGATAYAAADPGVWKLGFQQGDELLSGLTATDVAVDGATVYFTSDDATNGARVLRLDTATLQSTPIADTTGAYALALDSQDLFFTDGDAFSVRRVVGKSGPVVDVASLGGTFSPVDLATDGSCVFFTAVSRIDQSETGVVDVAPAR